MASKAALSNIADIVTKMEIGFQRGDIDEETYATSIVALIAEYHLSLQELEELDELIQNNLKYSMGLIH